MHQETLDTVINVSLILSYFMMDMIIEIVN